MGSARLIWRAEVYDVDLGQPIGHEPGFRRPAVVVSANVLHNGAGELVAVVPITSTRYKLRSHIELEPGSTGLDHVSYARCDQLRFVSTQRVVESRGYASHDAMSEIDRALRFVLDL